jgi:hypothetical protein
LREPNKVLSKVNPSDQKKFFFEQGRVFRVYCYEDMIVDNTR